MKISLLPLLQHYTPTSFDKSYASHEVDKHDVEFTFWDTSGELRLSYITETAIIHRQCQRIIWAVATIYCVNIRGYKE